MLVVVAERSSDWMVGDVELVLMELMETMEQYLVLYYVVAVVVVVFLVYWLVYLVDLIDHMVVCCYVVVFDCMNVIILLQVISYSHD